MGLQPVPSTSASASEEGWPTSSRDGNWACPQCNNVNYAIRLSCNRCNAPKPEERPVPRRSGRAPVAGVDGNWACPVCRNVNFATRSTCNRCGEAKPEELISDAES